VGGGFPIAPSAMLDDGLVDVTIVPVQQVLELVGAGVDLMRGDTTRSDALLTHQSRRVRIISEPSLPFSVDGEQRERSVAALEVVPRAVRVVTGGDPVALTITDDSG
jgi:diacylglycerol kinase family enzyme